MSKAKFEVVKELINEKNYEEARAILRTIDHPTAREWEIKLEKISPVAITKNVKTTKSTQKRSISRIGCIGLIALGLIVIVALFPNSPNSRNQENPVALEPSQTSITVTTPDSTNNTVVPSATIIETLEPTQTSTPTDVPTLTPTYLPTAEPLIFDSANSGQQPVLGPISIPSGVYRVTVQTDGFFIGDLEANSGSCDVGFGGLFNLNQGQGKGGASTILKSDNCSALIAISNVTEAWSLKIEQITDLTPRINQLKFSNTTEGTQPVIGPLVLPSGTYRARVVTSGFFIGDIEALNGNCDVGFMGLFNLSSGQATNGAETILKSTDCETLISLSNISAPWTLEFEKIS